MNYSFMLYGAVLPTSVEPYGELAGEGQLVSHCFCNDVSMVGPGQAGSH